MNREELIKALAQGMRPEAWSLDTGTNDAQYEAYQLAEDTLDEVSESLESEAYDEVSKHYAEQLLEPISDLQMLITDIENDVIDGDAETLENVVKLLNSVAGRY